MLKSKLLAIGATVGIAALIATPALAWHPKGTIVKKVQDVTANSALVDANDAASALAVNKGDTLKYVITISNIGDAASNGYNDMAKTVLTDTLPAGVVLANGGSSKITENIGTIKPGQSVTKEYLVKVTSTKDADVVTNKACFTGNSTANDNPQSGCDNAVVKVHVPETPPVTPPTTPTTPETPETPSTPELPAALPSTGPEAFVGTTLILGAAAYGATRALRSNKLAAIFNK